jgi:hypothetical protein
MNGKITFHNVVLIFPTPVGKAPGKTTTKWCAVFFSARDIFYRDEMWAVYRQTFKINIFIRDFARF